MRLHMPCASINGENIFSIFLLKLFQIWSFKWVLSKKTISQSNQIQNWANDDDDDDTRIVLFLTLYPQKGMLLNISIRKFLCPTNVGELYFLKVKTQFTFPLFVLLIFHSHLHVETNNPCVIFLLFSLFVIVCKLTYNISAIV